MNIYVVNAAVDNPAFEGLALAGAGKKVLDTWPSDWRVNYQTWEPRRLLSAWSAPKVTGNVRRFNDYPCINLTRPAFSQRAVDLLSDLLEPNGELLPVHHETGCFYFFNCTRMTNCVDLAQSETTRLNDGGVVTSTKRLVFKGEMTQGLTIFKVRTQLLELFCTQDFVERVERAGLLGFVFTPIWPLPLGVTFYDEMYRVGKLAAKWKPKGGEPINVSGNTVVIRLYTEKKKPAANESAAANDIMQQLEASLYSPTQELKDYLGNIEGHEACEFEIRIFISSPDCDRLVRELLPVLRILKWPGRYHVVKRRGEFTDKAANEEYVNIFA